jgi:tRNA threonylcarbamoyladenosine biosynthesis protein TsaB
MARLLAVDTTSNFGSLALLEDDCVVEEMMLHSPDGFGHVLFDHLRALLARRAWTLASIDCFAAASGPGSFTGVRVGLAAAKGLAEAGGKPLVAVSNLKAIAWHGSRPVRAVVVDARRGEIYGGLYDASLAALRDEVVIKLPAFLASLPPGDLEFLSTDFSPFRMALAGTRFETATVVSVPRAMAGAIGRIAWSVFKAGTAPDPAAVDANYVRRSDAELLWKDDGATLRPPSPQSK